MMATAEPIAGAVCGKGRNVGVCLTVEAKRRNEMTGGLTWCLAARMSLTSGAQQKRDSVNEKLASTGRTLHPTVA